MEAGGLRPSPRAALVVLRPGSAPLSAFGSGLSVRVSSGSDERRSGLSGDGDRDVLESCSAEFSAPDASSTRPRPSRFLSRAIERSSGDAASADPRGSASRRRSPPPERGSPQGCLPERREGRRRPWEWGWPPREYCSYLQYIKGEIGRGMGPGSSPFPLVRRKKSGRRRAAARSRSRSGRRNRLVSRRSLPFLPQRWHHPPGSRMGRVSSARRVRPSGGTIDRTIEKKDKGGRI